jgi:uncharacterized protein involved in exopolysaccharide biosynthesis
MSVPPPLEVEQEVDFGRYWKALVARWWLLLLGLVIGAVIGALATLGGGSGWKATSQVYLGQPLAPGGAPVSSASTTLSLVANAVTSNDTIRSVAAKVGLKPAQLRGHVTSKPILGVTGSKIGVAAPLLGITVTGAGPHALAASADAFADAVVKLLSPYLGAKIQTLKERVAYDGAQLTAVNDRLKAARLTQTQILADKTISATDKLVALANLNSVITQALAQQVGLQQDLFGTRQDLSLAQDIEAAHIVTRATASRSPGPGRRTAVVIGAFIGLLIGIVAALLWEPLIARPRPSPLK